jgi:hypothetical protein
MEATAKHTHFRGKYTHHKLLKERGMECSFGELKIVANSPLMKETFLEVVYNFNIYTHHIQKVGNLLGHYYVNLTLNRI